jgi:DNA repair and recombination protein RAD52
MAGAFSQHLINSYHTHTQRRAPFVAFGGSTAPTDLAVHGAMSFAPGMHGSFREHSSFDTQPSFLDVSEATATRIAELQAKLDRKLGPEFVSQRPGPGGGPKLTYAEGWKIMNLANEIFGFNGWSSSIVNLTVDFIDFNEESKRYTVGTTAIIRVTLRDGVFHEDVGYGMLENSKSKGQALDKVCVCGVW